MKLIHNICSDFLLVVRNLTHSVFLSSYFSVPQKHRKTFPSSANLSERCYVCRVLFLKEKKMMMIQLLEAEGNAFFYDVKTGVQTLNLHADVYC